jgi:hypothetical protein
MELMARHGQDDEWDDDLGWIDEPATPRRPAKSVAATAAPAVAAPERSTPDPDPDPDAPLELEDDDWHVEPPPVPKRRPDSGSAWSRTARRRRGPLGSPVVLLALYSIAGIALIVLAVNLLSGSFSGSDDPAPVTPAADRVPVEEPAAATPTPAATAAPAVSDFELGQREKAATDARAVAIAAAERAVRTARTAERRRIARARRARAARARARKKAAARARRRAAAPPAATTTPPATAPAPAPAQPAPAPSGGGGGGGGGGGSCEFCIG